MIVLPRVPLIAVLLLLGCGRSADGPHDPSPHRVAFLPIRPDVTLEYLDWGGTGVPMLFLSGLGDTGHEFDDFAPRWTDHFHVLALTRRGFGASSQPGGGYDIGTLVEDIRLAMDSLKLERAVLVGHSIAGDELTKFAAIHPDRVGKLVYLDAAHDRVGLGAMLERDPPPAPPPMGSADSSSAATLQRWLARSYGITWPIGEVLSVAVFGPDGRYLRDVTPESVNGAVLRGLEHPAYGKIRAPALAFYAVLDSVQQVFPTWAEMDASDRAKAVRFFARFEPWVNAQAGRFEKEVTGGRVVQLHGAHHYIFISNEAEVTRAMRAFLLEP